MVDSNQSARFTSLEELLAAIQRRPTAYLSKCYISCLKAFLDGWHLLAYQYGVEVEGQALGAFQDWIAAKYCVTSSQSWADIILFYSQDECDALTNFFRLFEEWQQTVNAPL